MDPERFSFHEEKPAVTIRKRESDSSGITNWLMSHSFGLIKTRLQAEIVQIIIVIICLLYVFVMLHDSTESPVQLPSQELIDSPQSLDRLP